MNRLRVIFELKLEIIGPLVVHSSNPARFGIDAVSEKDLDGRAIIPGTLLKGKFREVMEQTGAKESLLAEWLGLETEATENEENNREPRRARIHFSDLMLSQEGHSGNIIHRIRIDQEMGSVEPHCLLIIESPLSPGEIGEFTGTITAYLEEDAIEITKNRIRKSIDWIRQIGSYRSIGYGRIRKGSVVVKEMPPQTSGQKTSTEEVLLPVSDSLEPANLNQSKRIKLVLEPEGPLCLSRPKIGDNLFESEDSIPGNAIAGALVETWLALCGLPSSGSLREAAAIDPEHQVLADVFDQIGFTAAHPTKPDQEKPKAVPLSKAYFDDDQVFYDMATFKAPAMLVKESQWYAPTFKPDWKYSTEAYLNRQYGWVEPRRELRVRTAIDGSTGTSFQESGQGKLFAHQRVLNHDCNGKRIHWISYLSLNEIHESKLPETINSLDYLLRNLSFLSKTKTRCKVQIEKASRPSYTITDGEHIAFCLQSPTLLADPRFQFSKDEFDRFSDPSERLHKAYDQAWSDLSHNRLELSHFFASQSLAGGNYLAYRFKNNQPYEPWLLTDAGSVFVFHINSMDTDSLKIDLENWLTDGLPLPRWAVERFGETWQENPFIPQNGFGEIAQHHLIDVSPTDEFFQPLASTSNKQ